MYIYLIKKSAKILLNLYRNTLFFGSDNTDWLVELSREFYEPEHAKLMKKLSQRPNSTLGQDARNLLEFMEMSDSQRQQNYPVDITNKDNSEWAAWSIASEQLDQALSIPSRWDVQYDRDCLNGISCTD